MQAASDPPARILVLNAGASSLKFALYEPTGGSPVRGLHGMIERLGTARATLHLRKNGQPLPVVPNNGASPIDGLFRRLEEETGGARPDAIGHRIVHGGAEHGQPCELSPGVLEKLRGLVTLDPAHMPAALELVDRVAATWPGALQVGCFDTMFHHDLPQRARLFALPWRYQAAGIRRFGFHGLSFRYVMDRLQAESPSTASGRVVIAHLGSGSSLAAVEAGRCIDTTMGMTPAGGIPMATRTGDLDPGVLIRLLDEPGMDTQALLDLVNSQSGLLGVSGISGDVRDLLEREPHAPRAAAALDLFTYRVSQQVGAFAVALGGLDELVFTGGIGAGSPVLRERICARLKFLGVRIDASANRSNRAIVSVADSPVTVRALRTDEESVIAAATAELLQANRRAGDHS